MPAPHRAVLPGGHAKLVTTVPGTKNPKNLALGFLEPASGLACSHPRLCTGSFLEDSRDVIQGSDLCLETAQMPELPGQAWFP